MAALRILLAEEQPATREAVRALLERDGHDIVGEVTDGQEALRGVQQFKPDLIVLSLRLRRLGGLEVLRRLRQQEVAVKAVVLTAADSAHIVGMCMEAGAAAFVSKLDDLSELSIAVKAVAANRRYFPELDLTAKGDSRAMAEAEQVATLSPRELSVFGYLAEGYGNRDIARELSLSDRTVSTYKVRLFEKLNIKSLVELAEVAKRNKVLARNTLDSEYSEPAFAHGGELSLLRAVLDAIPSTVSVRDPKGKLLFANQYLLALYENFAGEAIGAGFGELGMMDSSEAVKLEKVYMDAVARDASFSVEVVVRYRGQNLARLYWGTPVKREGVTVAFVCGLQDVQEQEATFLHLRAAKERAEAESAFKSRLLVEFTQNLRRSITQLHESLSSLDAGANAIGDRKALADARMSVEMLDGEMANLDALIGGESASPGVRERCNLLAIVGDAVAQMNERANGLELRFIAEKARVDEAEIWLDIRRFKQLLHNLLTQIIAHSGAEQVEVRLTTELRSRAMLSIDIHLREVPLAGCVPRASSSSFPMLVAASIADAIGAQLSLVSQVPLSLRLHLDAPRAD